MYFLDLVLEEVDDLFEINSDLRISAEVWIGAFLRSSNNESMLENCDQLDSQIPVNITQVNPDNMFCLYYNRREGILVTENCSTAKMFLCEKNNEDLGECMRESATSAIKENDIFKLCNTSFYKNILNLVHCESICLMHPNCYTVIYENETKYCTQFSIKDKDLEYCFTMGRYPPSTLRHKSLFLYRNSIYPTSEPLQLSNWCPGVEAPPACSSKTVMRWPLVPMLCTQDVLLSTGARSGASCPLTFVDDHPYAPDNSPFPSVRLSAGSYIDIRLSSILSNSDYGFSAFVNPDTNNHSCILHYKSDDGLFNMKFLSGISETRATVSTGENLTVTHYSLQLGQWQKIGIGVDESQRKIRLSVDISVFDDDDNAEKVTSDAATGSLTLHTPGTLRVGGSFDGETYSGLVSCVSLIADKKLDCSSGCYQYGTWSG
ncbi:uncharacterized protein LOC134257218, partial [Saccostrea cucullata]|uniref:uncharacterized protein LOC134257218 n=1 Tax=Saccostrea cuccullata TaxID=36930 RepID=UPI002ED0E966